ncbi:rab-GTPase-TBC domain-containing protein [Boeremia exigua]|uniref:rab-GTPase-TBC domain-containing protein n=1 Tax=Boeremia exigua TaxID=749465 RepID=UPI001E8D98E1|nr:rab-GTPase-TBC domain-containing protein [Boeremia exigua]KAH6643661.1 rab-GTPase-TBC domain-containing protein [Boeremia exigua]
MRDDNAAFSGSALVATTSDPSAQHSPPTCVPANAAKPPLKGPAPRGWLTSVRRPRTSPGPRSSALRRTQLLADNDDRRDSALASSNCTTRSNAPSSPTSVRRTPSLPAIVIQDNYAEGTRKPSSRCSLDSSDAHESPFQGIDMDIPTGSFDDFTSSTQVSFSNRGSMMLGGKKANRRSKQINLVLEGANAPEPAQQEREQQVLSPPAVISNANRLSPTPRTPSRYSARARAGHRVLSADEMTLSRKVRSMYQHGNESDANWDVDTNSLPNNSVDNSITLIANESTLTVNRNRDDASSFVSSRGDDHINKEPTETAGGLEDWADLEGAEVDRYGFIVAKKPGSREGANGEGLDGPDEPRIQRVSTALQLIAEEPRHRGVGRTVSRARSSRSADPRSSPPKRRVSQKSSRQARSIFSNRTSGTRTSYHPLRQATNRLPHNRERRLLEEASDMLKLPPGLAQVAEQREGGRMARSMKTKEIKREEKWRAMAKIVKTSTEKGGGMLFEFDTKDPKLVTRTWKGIPDRWRATAWYSFLAESAKKKQDSPSEDDLIESFYALQGESSAEDVQIDVDVPRTINRHIMFRRRYRGGQRLLFRVLHAMSLYLPETGYVQGMAPLAATLLCYYEEDRAFVMLVRLWMLRGLERLYESGFSGLMDALDDFEKNWLRGGDVAQKLNELGITSTAWGTRWYLTLFNYSLPFQAQLRVWDVFMLLGDASHSNCAASKFSGDLDVLHATSAALIDATREILLDSDFENGMKVLTSWIPIKDEDLLMRVARTEYRLRKKRANV